MFGLILLTIIIIIVYVARVVPLNEQVFNFSPQPFVIRNNLIIQIDIAIYFQIVNPKIYVYGVKQPMDAIENITVTTLRNIIKEVELESAFISRDIVNKKMEVTLATLGEVINQWGIKVNQVEIKNILLSRVNLDIIEKNIKFENESREYPFVIGDRVSHNKFGFGVVASIDDKKLRVRFVDSEREIATSFSKKFLTKHLSDDLNMERNTEREYEENTDDEQLEGKNYIKLANNMDIKINIKKSSINEYSIKKAENKEHILENFISKERKVLFFDVETNGFRGSSVLSFSAFFIKFKQTEDGKKYYSVLEKINRYYYPREKYNVYATNINGLRKSVLDKKRVGVMYEEYFLDDLYITELCEKTDLFVAHNIAFDESFMPIILKKENKLCTMNDMVNTCKLPLSNGRYKKPKLMELAKFMGVPIDEKQLHNSLYDVEVMFQSFLKMAEHPSHEKRIADFLFGKSIE